MATVLDIGLLQNFSIVFTFLFVFVVIYGILSYSKFLGDNKGIHAMIGVVLAFIAILSDLVVEFLSRATPWFILFMFLIVFVLMIVKTFGTTNEQISATFKRFEWIMYWTVGVAIFIGIFFAIDVARFDGVDGEGDGSSREEGDVGAGGREGFFAVIQHPKVVGLLIILMIASFAVKRLTETSLIH